ncbi:MAG: hypothetical protein HQ558_01615 [Candidatus Omnitrophica bacterium]|nr:hypothetical protein [Candidatus Omnitrophota bacterium]
MMRTIFNRAAALFICALFLASLILYAYRILGPKERAADFLEMEERKMIEKHGLAEKKIYFPSSYTVSDGGMLEAADGKGVEISGNVLNIHLSDDEKKQVRGFLFSLSLVIKDCYEDGVLQFLIRGNGRPQQRLRLQVYLKEINSGEDVAVASKYVVSDRAWHTVSIPLVEFLPDDNDYENRDFSWEIREILFSVEPSGMKRSLRLSIRNIRITDGRKVVYKLL